MSYWISGHLWGPSWKWTSFVPDEPHSTGVSGEVLLLGRGIKEHYRISEYLYNYIHHYTSIYQHILYQALFALSQLKCVIQSIEPQALSFEVYPTLLPSYPHGGWFQRPFPDRGTSIGYCCTTSSKGSGFSSACLLWNNKWAKISTSEAPSKRFSAMVQSDQFAEIEENHCWRIRESKSLQRFGSD